MPETTATIAGTTPEQRRAMLRELLERKAQQAQTFPLSLAQEALWFLDQLDPARPTYSLYAAVRVQGAVNLKALEQALGEMVRRHDTLRTCFPEVDGVPVQRISPPQPFQLPIVDLRHLPEEQRQAEAQRIAEERPVIDLQRGPIFRPQVVWLAENDFILKLQIHHIVFDGWSFGVTTRELSTLYRAFAEGRPSPLARLPIRYADFAAWQRQYLQGETLQQLQDYWRTQLSGLPPLDLPTDFPRPAIRTSRGATLPLAFSPELTQAVVDFSRRERVTTFMTLLAGFEELLHRYSGQEDFALGTPTANRRQKNVEPLIGYFINMLVLRADLSGDPSFRQLLQRVRATALAAYEHQELTLDKVVEAVQPERDMSRHPLFQVMFVLQNNRRPPLRLPNLKVSSIDASRRERTSKFELTMPLRMTPEGIVGKLNFNTDLFAPETIQRMLGHYQMILADALADPDRPLSQLRLVSDAERETILVNWNVAALPSPAAGSIAELFTAQADRQPQAEAVVAGTVRLSYGELNARANRLARRLQRRGVGPEVVVGLCLERSADLITTILAVWKAGGAYLPLDPAYSQDAQQRLQFVLQDAGASLVVTDSTLSGTLGLEDGRLIQLDRDAAAIQAESEENLPCPATPEHLAYILYTSGSTGQPKGVMVTQGSLLNAYQGWETAYGLGTQVHSHLQMASFGFDVFAGDLVRAVGSGGKLVICPKEILLSAEALLELLRRERVEAAEFVPVVLRNLVEHLEAAEQRLDFMHLVAVGSDAWYAEDHQRTQRVLGPQTRLVNSYGLTETTIDSTYFEGDVAALPQTGIVPIGRPFANVRLYVLDEHQRPVPVGVRGELYIGGPGVARGYVNRPDLDAERFLPDPFAAIEGARMCRTGDRVRWRADGQLEFLGRADDQVKIRGFRIEPGEIEEALREHPLLADAAVLARPRSGDDLQLVAYMTARSGEAPAIAELRRFLRQRLPEYMIPAVFVALDAMPMTSSGKIDRRALPEPDWSSGALRGEYVAPRTATEQRLAAIWCEVLRVSRVGANDNFFDLGGNSLLAVRLTAQVRQAFSIDLPLVALFAAPTLSELGARIAELQTAGRTRELPPITRAVRHGPIPASFTQRRYWDAQQEMPDAAVLNLHAALPFAGGPKPDVLLATVNEVVRRHEVLRTTFQLSDDGELLQVIAPELRLELPVEDLRPLPAEQRDEEVRRRSQEEAARPFDLRRGPLLRLRLLQRDDDDYVLLVTVHHTVFDGWSLQVLVREVSEIYDAAESGRPPRLPEVPLQYADYAVWERQYLRGEVYESLREYWRRRLDGLRPMVLPIDHPRPAGAIRTRGRYHFRISAELRSKLERLCGEGVTPFVVLLAAFKVLVQRYCGTDDIAIFIPVANRNRREVQGLVGPFVNNVVLRTDSSGDPSFREFLGRVRQVAAEAYEHQEFPANHAVAALPAVEPSRGSPLPAQFNYHQRTTSQRVKEPQDVLFGPRIAAVELDHGVRELDLTVAETPQGCRCRVIYDTGLFERETAERIAKHYVQLLEAAIADPGQRLSCLAPQVAPADCRLPEKDHDGFRDDHPANEAPHV